MFSLFFTKSICKFVKMCRDIPNICWFSAVHVSAKPTDQIVSKNFSISLTTISFLNIFTVLMIFFLICRQIWMNFFFFLTVKLSVNYCFDYFFLLSTVLNKRCVKLSGARDIAVIQAEGTSFLTHNIFSLWFQVLLVLYKCWLHLLRYCFKNLMKNCLGQRWVTKYCNVNI